MTRLALLITALPVLAYGAGYLLWIAPSRMLYGVNIAPALGIKSLLEPGVMYVGVLAIAACASAVTGIGRLFAEFELLDNFVKQRSRVLHVLFDLAFWAVLCPLAVLGYQHVYGNPTVGFLDPAGSTFYLALHIVLVAASFRRMYGILKGSIAPPPNDRRQRSTLSRLGNAGLIVVLLIAQVQLAVLFGAFGPNPAKRVRPVAVYQAPEGSQSSGGASQELLLLHQSPEELIAYDTAREAIVRIPARRVDKVEMLRYSTRQQRLIEAVQARKHLSKEDVDAFFDVRPSLKSVEIAAVELDPRVRRTPSEGFATN